MPRAVRLRPATASMTLRRYHDTLQADEVRLRLTVALTEW
jgi:hypothetical protein